ncbi:MAG: hydrogenase maturation nickel metallochaperone HypA [Syntrophomonadaceae bacterium]|jgi:hydrogenase nickel incorporation protein HypA/HybF|nr:hydrogenase maturation nickel metallochaperone HypA [Syntrophomonadaceae bacterium]
MHEMALMDGVLNAVRESARDRNLSKINKIKLVVGKFSMALPDSLQFAFEVLSQEEIFAGAVLEIEERDIVCQCRGCQLQFEIDNTYRFVCPGCESRQVEIISGRELYIDCYEGEEADGTG